MRKLLLQKFTYKAEDLSYFDPTFWISVQHETVLFHLSRMIFYQLYFQWYLFQHTYTNFHTITLTIGLSPKEALSGKKKKSGM